MQPTSHQTPEAAGFETRLCEQADRAEQAALYDLCFDKRDGARVLAWRYDANPAGEAVSFLTRTEGGLAVSGYACNPRLATARGEASTTAPIGQTGDVMTHPEWRGRGVFSALDRAAMAETGRRGWPFVLGLPNRQSEGIFTGKLGWQLVGRIRPFTFVLRGDAAARAERMRKSRLAAWSAPLARIAGLRRRGAARRLSSGLRVEQLARFTSEADALFDAVAPEHALIVRRDSAYLNWRFCDAPSGLFRAFAVRDSAGELCAWSVVQMGAAERRIGYLVDLLARDEAAHAAAVEAALSDLESRGCSVVRAHAIEGSTWQERLRSAGFLPGKEADHKAVIAYVHDREHPLGALATQPERWYFTDGDRDDELVSG